MNDLKLLQDPTTGLITQRSPGFPVFPRLSERRAASDDCIRRIFFYVLFVCFVRCSHGRSRRQVFMSLWTCRLCTSASNNVIHGGKLLLLHTSVFELGGEDSCAHSVKPFTF